MKEILKAYKKELSKDLIEIKEFASSGLNQEGFDDGIKYQAKSIDGLWQVLVIGPGRLTVGGPFLLIAYIGNRFVAYSFIPILVISKSGPKIHTLLGLIEKFLKTFFGLFGITEIIPQLRKRSREKGSNRLKRFQKFSKEFQRNGPKMVDDLYADMQRRIYDVFENNVIHRGTLFKGDFKKVEGRYIERITAIKVVFSMKRERVPNYMKLGKDTGSYRYELLMEWVKMPKEVIKCKLLRTLRYIYTGFGAICILIQGCLLTIEIIIVPEWVSLNIRLYIKHIRYKIKRIFIK